MKLQNHLDSLILIINHVFNPKNLTFGVGYFFFYIIKKLDIRYVCKFQGRPFKHTIEFLLWFYYCVHRILQLNTFFNVFQHTTFDLIFDKNTTKYCFTKIKFWFFIHFQYISSFHTFSSRRDEMRLHFSFDIVVNEKTPEQ